MCRSDAPRSTAALMIFSIDALSLMDESAGRLQESHAVSHLAHRFPRDGAAPWPRPSARISSTSSGCSRSSRARARIGASVAIILSASTRLQSRQPHFAPRAILLHLGDRLRRGEVAMQVVDVADLRIARILPRHPRRIGRRGTELLPDLLGRVEQPDRVAEALRHLGLAVESDDPLGLGEQRLRLGEVGLSPAELGVPPPRDLAGQLEVLDLVLARRARGRRDRAGCRRPSAPDTCSSPTGTLSSRCDLSLNCVIRSSSPSGVTEFSSHWSSVCSGTCDCTKSDGALRIDAAGEQADRHLARALRRARRARTSPVMACRSTTQMHGLVAVLELDPVLHRPEPVADVQLA